MHILQFTAENFKRIRVVEITPKGRVTTVTGRNGQGKTSVLDALWALFAGRRATPDKPVRRGADKSKLSATISDEQGKPYLIAKRTIAADRTTNLTVEAAPGAVRPAGTPQAVLDGLIGEMTFDPVAFIKLEPKKQVEQLRKVVAIDANLDELSEMNRIDYGERTIVNRAVDELRAQVAAAIYSPNLPAEKVDEAEILARIEEVNAANRGIGEKLKARAAIESEIRNAQTRQERAEAEVARLDAVMERIEAEQGRRALAVKWAAAVNKILGEIMLPSVEGFPEAWAEQVLDAFSSLNIKAHDLSNGLDATALTLETELEVARVDRKTAEQVLSDAVDAAATRMEELNALPPADVIDTSGLMKELETARLTNREIDRRARAEELQKQLTAKQQESATLTRRMEAREEQKREALAGAKMPVDGLTFNEEGVAFKGIPLPQLGEAEQIRVSCALAMAAAPQLRCMPIAHGESLDSESLALIEKMAEENDFQIFMARVDTTGKVGIVIEDGMVQTVNE